MLRAIAVANGDYGLHSGLPRPRDHLLAIGVELLAIKMRVRIDKHDYCLCRDSRPRLSMPSQARLVFGHRVPYRRATLSFTSISPLPAHPPKSPPERVSRLRAMRLRSSHSIPCRAACEAQDWPRSLLFVQSKFRGHRLLRFQPAPAAPRFQYQSPAAEVCRP